MKFDPERKRLSFIEGGGLERAAASRELSGKPIGNYADIDLHSVAYSWLVGLHQEMAPVIPRALGWLDQAIERREVMGPSAAFHQMQLHWARAMGKWMLHGQNAADDWFQALYLEQAYWQDEPNTAAWTVAHCLDDYMAFAVQAGRYAEGINTYERLVGAKKLSPSKIRKPGEYAYALCLQQGQGLFNEQDIFEAGRRVLQANLEDSWLGRGQSLRGATWLKIVYWDRDLRVGRTPALTPLQTVLKAYENMPGVAVPDFVSG